LIEDTNIEGETNNVKETLDHQIASLHPENDLLLICGSFFIMTEVRQYFGYEEVVDRIL